MPPTSETLTTLTASLDASAAALKAPGFPTATPPENGISLLDVKNELLLSYLHSAAFLVLLKLRSTPLAGDGVGADLVKDLVRLRVLLEKGVRPLEAKLKYQLDKVVAASVAADLSTVAPPVADTEPDTDADTDTGTDSGGVEHDDYGVYNRKKPPPPHARTASAVTNTELSFRPNPHSLSKPSTTTTTSSSSGTATATTGDGVYRPPRISATSMPEHATAATRKAERAGRSRSHMLDEFIADELSAAPRAQPSVGSTILGGGRVSKSSRERREETERTEYEESNFVRLPGVSKKEMRERKRKGAGGGGGGGEGFGGEEWGGFDGELERLTKGGKRSALERSRKRASEETAGGGRLGGEFGKMKKRLNKRRKT